MIGITKSRSDIKVSYMEVKLATGTITLGYQSDTDLVFTPITKKGSSGNEVAIGYRINLTFELMQNDEYALSEWADYVKNVAAAPIIVYGYTIGNYTEQCQIDDMKGVIQPRFRAMEYSPIKMRFTKVISIDEFYDLFARTAP